MLAKCLIHLDPDLISVGVCVFERVESGNVYYKFMSDENILFYYIKLSLNYKIWIQRIPFLNYTQDRIKFIFSRRESLPIITLTKSPSNINIIRGGNLLNITEMLLQLHSRWACPVASLMMISVLPLPSLPFSSPSISCKYHFVVTYKFIIIIICK